MIFRAYGQYTLGDFWPVPDAKWGYIFALNQWCGVIVSEVQGQPLSTSCDRS